MTKKAADPRFEALVASDFTRIPRNFLWVYTWVSRYLLRYEDAVFKAIICSTWGFNKMEGWVSVNLIARFTGILPQHIYRTLGKLILYRMIIKKHDKHGHVWLAVEHDYRKWRVSTETGYVDLGKVKIRKLFPTEAEAAHYKKMEQWEEADEIN